jgi:hypothetical protein
MYCKCNLLLDALQFKIGGKIYISCWKSIRGGNLTTLECCKFLKLDYTEFKITAFYFISFYFLGGGVHKTINCPLHKTISPFIF